MLRITLSRLGSPEHVIDLRDRTLRIGRGAGNEVLLQDPDKTVSRTHGEVRREAAGWVFIDNDSQNGSWVDGRSVDRVVLRDGVVVAFGDYELICEETVSPEEAARAPAGVAGQVPLGPDEQTRLGPDATTALPSQGADDLHQMPTIVAPAFMPSDDTTPAQAPPVRRTDIHDLPTIVAPSFMPSGQAPSPPPTPPVRRTDIHDQPTVFAPAYQPGHAADDEDDAKTIVVPSDAAAPIVTSVAAADAIPDEMAELPTIVVPGFGSVPPPAATISAPEVDEESATLLVPSAGAYAPPPAPPAPPPPAAPPPPVAVEPSWFDRGPGAAPAAPGDHPTVLAAPTPVFPVVPSHDVDATQVVPGDLSELFRTPAAPVAPVGPRPATAPGGFAPPPPPVEPAEAEDIATVLIPGRPATGQLAAPPRSSGEMPVPPPAPPPAAPAVPAPSSGSWAAFPPPAEAAPAPWTLPAMEPVPVGTRTPTPAPFPGPASEPPVAVPVAPPTAAVPVPPPVTAVATPHVAPVAVPPAPVMAPPVPEPPRAAAPVPPPATPQVPAPKPAVAASFRPAVLLWGLAWLALFGLIGAGIWIWTSSDGGGSAPAPVESSTPATPSATQPPPAQEPTQPVAQVATESAPPPVTPAPGTTPAPPVEATPTPSPPPEAAPPPPPPPTPASTSPEVWADRPPPTPQATGVPRKPGERAADYRKRVADIERQYMAGRDALAAGRAVEARDLLRAVAAAAPTYKDVDGLLRDAEAAVRREGMAALASAEKLEQAREFEKALAALRRAEQFGAPADQVGAVSARVQQQMRAAGEKAFADARQFDGLGRNADAARLYEIAVRYLPEGDPRRAQARQRLDVLTARRP